MLCFLHSYSFIRFSILCVLPLKRFFVNKNDYFMRLFAKLGKEELNSFPSVASPSPSRQ